MPWTAAWGVPAPTDAVLELPLACYSPYWIHTSHLRHHITSHSRHTSCPSTSGSVWPLGIPCKELSWLFLLLLLLCAVLVSLSPVVWWWLAGPGLGCHIPSFAAHRPGDSEQPHRCRDLTVTPAQQTCCQHDTPTSLSFSVINHHQSWDQSNINLFSFICQITRSARPSQRRGINNEIITPGSVRAVCIK